jgi:hypothetical protein
MPLRSGVDIATFATTIQKRINSDQELSALKKLRDIQTDGVDKLNIQSLIDKRINEITDKLLKERAGDGH